VLNRRSVQIMGQGQEQVLSGFSRIRKNPELDQSVCFQGCVGLPAHGVGQAFGSDQDDRVKVMGLGSKASTFGWSQLKGRHARIIDAG
jgi:hypothetical protein